MYNVYIILSYILYYRLHIAQAVPNVNYIHWMILPIIINVSNRM